LGEILREQGALTEEVHALLETLVRKHLERHGQDFRESLAAVQPNAALAADLANLPDPQIQASVAPQWPPVAPSPRSGSCRLPR
jgi:hypothetical protein